MKGLEDAFDGANRKNLRHFISLADDDDADDPARGMLSQTTTVINGGEGGDALTSLDYVDVHRDAQAKSAALYYTAHASRQTTRTLEKRDSVGGRSGKGDEEEEVVEEKKELVRIDSCAIFHKLTPGQGVPHSFVGFVRQWPALPRVVVSFSFSFLLLFVLGSVDGWSVG